MKRTKFKNRNKITWLSCLKLIFVLAMVSLMIYLYVVHLPTPTLTNAPLPELLEQKETSEIIEPTYITETCFDGEKEVNPILFHYPFQKTDFYISNKDLVKHVDDNTIQKLQEDAAEFVFGYFQLDVNSFFDDYSYAMQNFNNFFVPESSYYDLKGNLLDTKQYTSDLVAALCNSNWQCQVDFESDKSLVWSDNAYYVRGYLTIHTYKISNSVNLTRYYPFEIHGNTDIKAVIDIGLIPGVNNYRMTSINYIWLPKEG